MIVDPSALIAIALDELDAKISGTVQMAEMTGQSRSTIEYYRRSGLLSPPLPRNQYTISGVYKAYGPHNLKEVRTILDVKEEHRSLLDIHDMLHPESSEGDL